MREVLYLHRISTDWIELHLYPRVWVQTIPIVQIKIPLKIFHRERHKIGIAYINHHQIDYSAIFKEKEIIIDEAYLVLSDLFRRHKNKYRKQSVTNFNP